jgi:hypothetical protein
MGASYRTTRQVATAYPVAEALSLGSSGDLGAAAGLTCGGAPTARGLALKRFPVFPVIPRRIWHGSGTTRNSVAAVRRHAR